MRDEPGAVAESEGYHRTEHGSTAVAEDAGGQADGAPTPRALLSRFALPVAVVVAVAWLMLVHGQLRDLVSTTSWWFSALGYMECGSLSLRALANATCPLIGGVTGGSVANGIAFIAPGAVLVRLGLEPWLAYVVTATAFMAVAMIGAYALGRHVGLRRWFAFGAALVYLTSPSLLGMHGLGTTFWGVALLPGSVAAGLWCASRISGVDRRSLVAVALWFASVLVMLLTDGYGFAIGQAAVGLVMVTRAAQAWRSRRHWIDLGLLGTVNLAAVLVHRVLIPGAGEWGRSPIGLFRAMGADLTTLVVPSDAQWWSHLAPSRVDPSVLWGDGTNSRFNYLGLGLLVLAVVTVVVRRRERWVWPLVAVAVVTLILALGPSLKVDAVRGPLAVPVTFDSYLMPAEDAVVPLPTQVLYESVPGLDTMRATYRWITASRLALILLAALGVQHVWSRSRKGWVRGAVVAASAVAVAEIAPDVGALIDAYEYRGRVVDRIDAEVVEPMRQVVEPGSTIVIGPNGSGDTNHFLSIYLAPRLRAHMYNVGGDKALERAMWSWPEDVRSIIVGEGDFSDAAQELLEEEDADAVVVPFFDLRWSINSWPPTDEFAAAGRAAVEDARDDSALVTEVFQYFAVVTLADDETTLD